MSGAILGMCAELTQLRSRAAALSAVRASVQNYHLALGAGQAFDAAQAQGQIPAVEDLDPIMPWHSGKTLEEVHPDCMALRPRLHIEKLHKEGRLPVGHAMLAHVHRLTAITTAASNGSTLRRTKSFASRAPCGTADSRCIWAICSARSDSAALRQALRLFGDRRRGGRAGECIGRLQVMKQQYRFAGSFMGRRLSTSPCRRLIGWIRRSATNLAWELPNEPRSRDAAAGRTLR